MKNVKSNPPVSIVTVDEHETYRILYDDISSNGVKIEWADRHALADLAVMIVERNRLVDNLREEGESLVVSGDRGATITKKNFSRTAIEKLRPQILALMREFKMTPNSRKQMIAEVPQNLGDGWEGV